MLTCQETSELISAQYDRKLGLHERISMQLHLMMCRYCSAVARQIALIQRLVGMKTDVDLSSQSNACLPGKTREEIIAKIIHATSKNTTDNAAT